MHFSVMDDTLVKDESKVAFSSLFILKVHNGLRWHFVIMVRHKKNSSCFTENVIGVLCMQQLLKPFQPANFLMLQKVKLFTNFKLHYYDVCTFF